MDVGTKVAQAQNEMNEHIETVEELITAYEENIEQNPAYTEEEILLLKLWLRDNLFRYWVKVLQQSIRFMDDSNRSSILQLLNNFEKPLAEYINSELHL